jgi:hypothetical protein
VGRKYSKVYDRERAAEVAVILRAPSFAIGTLFTVTSAESEYLHKSFQQVSIKWASN